MSNKIPAKITLTDGEIERLHVAIEKLKSEYCSGAGGYFEDIEIELNEDLSIATLRGKFIQNIEEVIKY
jgi:hypothetical protein